uniref:Uncharacterized protein n=1 Tax=Glossina palpalis gambiensis TaxID=67801 RepID=A0A1B0ARW2_9MUSC
MVRLRFFPSFHVDSVITFNCERVFQRNPELFVSYVIDILKLCRATFVLVARFELHRKIKPFNVCKIHIRLRETLPALFLSTCSFMLVHLHSVQIIANRKHIVVENRDQLYSITFWNAGERCLIFIAIS